MINKQCHRVRMGYMADIVAMYTHLTEITKYLWSDENLSPTDVVLKLH